MTLSPAAIKLIAKRSHTLWDKFYVPSKLRSDPVYEAVRQELSSAPLPVLDVGCGLGLLTHYLRESGYNVPMTGFDCDQRKVECARTMAGKAGYQDVTFCQGDVRQDLPAHSGHVVMLDILQFMPLTDQVALLRTAATRVAPSGKLIIRSCLRDDSQRFQMTVLGDWLAKVTLWMKQGPVAYPSAEDLQSALGPLGLSLDIRPLWGGTPFNNHLIVAQRQASASGS